jgi:2-amino-4-hydroxy-6-hydroxymethyldihydropteridine diphosphokinase
MPRSTTEPASLPSENRADTAYIGLGANLGEPIDAIRAAFAAIERLPSTRTLARSPLYASAPIDSSGPDYINAVIAVSTRLTPQELLAKLQAIETAHGRERPYRNAPRRLDLDLLMQGEQTIHSPELTLPHPRMHERAFVLRPLADIAPDLAIPGHGPVAQLLPRVATQRVHRLDEDSPEGSAGAVANQQP